MIQTDAEDPDPEITLATAEGGAWRLVSRPARSHSEWQNLRLYGRGRRFDFGWNVKDHRLSMCYGHKQLGKRHPDVLEWVIQILKSQKS